MLCIGRIEAVAQSNGIYQGKWIALIDSHDSLAPVPPRKGINPFTGERTEFKAPETSAIVSFDGASVGSIYWAMDGPPMLIVEAQDDSAEYVASVAEEIANSLGARFVRESGEG